MFNFNVHFILTTCKLYANTQVVILLEILPNKTMCILVQLVACAFFNLSHNSNVHNCHYPYTFMCLHMNSFNVF